MPEADLVAAPGSPATLAAYVAVALGVSFLCSVWEAVLLSTPISHLQVMADKGKKSGRRLLQMRRRIDRPVTAILTLNTIAHTVGAAGAGAEATQIFGSRWFGLISAILTVAILVFSEIIPKTLGTAYCRQLAGMTGNSLAVLVRALAPVVAVLEQITRLMRPKRRGPTVTRAELGAMARVGAEEGQLDESEQLILENLMQLDMVKVRDVMTPRAIMFALPASLTVGEALDGPEELGFSRIPVYGRDHDDVKGYVLRHDIFERAASGHREEHLDVLARPIASIALGSSVAQALHRFISDKDHLFLVVDEFGGTAGLIALEDALETLLGREIVDESDTVVDLQALARQRYALHLKRDRERREAREETP
ncbi:MAG: CNNM domain-containing protein [Planctomycetota bacterium]|jgi:CBS domain containing-hemolysin-like protein